MDTKEVQRGKRRGWIKNAAIIFLAIMLVLTFFSNTIMNRSLPEVATQYVSSGTISAKIRGTGTVTANSAYDVKVTLFSDFSAVKYVTVVNNMNDKEIEELEAANEN